MNTIEFDRFGQHVRCERRYDPTGSRWWILVDGSERGAAFRAHAFDAHHDVAERALIWLQERGAIRIPDPPWQWVVVDDAGREWWARLTTVFDRDHDPRIGQQMVPRDVMNERQHRMTWAEERASPGIAELRVLIADIG